nr:NADH dehydrogenase subunit 5, mitochondrial [Tanacetum cinerariifolium]
MVRIPDLHTLITFDDRMEAINKNNIIDTIKQQIVSGVRFEASGRLTRRLTAMRAVFKYRYADRLQEKKRVTVKELFEINADRKSVSTELKDAKSTLVLFNHVDESVNNPLKNLKQTYPTFFDEDSNNTTKEGLNQLIEYLEGEYSGLNTGVITIVYASLSTLRTIDIKELIAYSSVSHAAVYLLGNMEIDVPKDMSDELANKVSKKIGIIDRLITTHGQSINDLLQKGVDIENKLKLENSNGLPDPMNNHSPDNSTIYIPIGEGKDLRLVPVKMCKKGFIPDLTKDIHKYNPFPNNGPHSTLAVKKVSLSFDDILGQTYAIYIIAIAGAESAIGLDYATVFSLAPYMNESVVTIVGAITTVFSSLIGLFQQDIKKVIAYSTMSQLGMMVIAVGAGAVIHAVADNQDFRRYGGLRPFLPLTYSVMLIASLSLVAFPFMTGFYSKDFILESAYVLLQSRNSISPTTVSLQSSTQLTVLLADFKNYVKGIPIGGIRFVINEWLKENTFLIYSYGGTRVVSNPTVGSGSLPVGVKQVGYISTMQSPNDQGIGNSRPAGSSGTIITDARSILEQRINKSESDITYYKEQVDAAKYDLDDIYSERLWFIGRVAFVTVAERKTMASMQRRLGPNAVGCLTLNLTHKRTFHSSCDALCELYYNRKALVMEFSDDVLFTSTHLLNPSVILSFFKSLKGYAVIPYGPGLVLLDYNLGSLRSTAQLISYELILSSAILLVVLLAGSIAETNRAPFDLAEASV